MGLHKSAGSVPSPEVNLTDPWRDFETAELLHNSSTKRLSTLGYQLAGFGLSFISVAGAVSNLTIFVVICRHRFLRTPINLMLLNLTVSKSKNGIFSRIFPANNYKFLTASINYNCTGKLTHDREIYSLLLHYWNEFSASIDHWIVNKHITTCRIARLFYYRWFCHRNSGYVTFLHSRSAHLTLTQLGSTLWWQIRCKPPIFQTQRDNHNQYEMWMILATVEPIGTMNPRWWLKMKTHYLLI